MYIPIELWMKSKIYKLRKTENCDKKLGGISMEMRVKNENVYVNAKKKDITKGIRRTNKKYKKAMTNLAK